MDNFAYELLDKFDNTNNKELSQDMILNIYLTLLSLSNYEYKPEFYLIEAEKIENFLRKVNNLKVKIQLGRKQNEIDNLLNEIKELYEKNIDLIKIYNKEKVDVLESVDSKEPARITEVIDKLTKEKLRVDNNREKYDEIRKIICDNINLHNYYIEDNTLFISIPDNPNFSISLSEFKHIFNYLLEIDNYKQPFLNNKANRMHTILTASLIKTLINKEISDNNLLIPLALTYITSKNRCFCEEIDASKFKINNIKITDLYNLATLHNKVDPNKCSKWQKIVIPNSYLYDRLCNIVLKGMYYFTDDSFVMEDIKDNTNDFKISISIDDILEFLKANLNSLIKKPVYHK